MDTRLSELQRDWERSGVGLEQLEAEYSRAGEPLPWAVLVATPRWRWLVELVDEGYGQRLEPGWGHSLEEIEQAERHPGLGEGARFPQALREWFRLVGSQLETHRDPLASAGLRKLSAFTSVTSYYPILGGKKTRGVMFWSAPARHVKWVAPLNAEGDPLVACDDLHQLVVGEVTPLSVRQCLQIWLIANTAHAYERQGPLGRVRELGPDQAAGWLADGLGGRVTFESYVDWINAHRPADPEAAAREQEEDLRRLMAMAQAAASGTGMPPRPAPTADDVEFGELQLMEAKRLYDAGNTRRALRTLNSVCRSLEGHALADQAQALQQAWKLE